MLQMLTSAKLSGARVSLGALAHQILHWEERSRHCPACGDTMTRVVRGWGKSCPACHALHFPAIHP